MHLHLLSRIIVLYSPQVEARYNELNQWQAAMFRRCIQNLKKDFSTPGWVKGPSQNRFSKFHASRFELSLAEMYFSQNVTLLYRCLDDDGFEVIDFDISQHPSPDNNNREISGIFIKDADSDVIDRVNIGDAMLYVLSRDIISRQYSSLFGETDIEIISITHGLMSLIEELSDHLLREICSAGYEIYRNNSFSVDISLARITHALRRAISLSGYLSIGDIIDLEIIFDDASSYSAQDVLCTIQDCVDQLSAQGYFVRAFEAEELECTSIHLPIWQSADPSNTNSHH